MLRLLSLAAILTLVACPVVSAQVVPPAPVALPLPVPSTILQADADLVDEGGPVPHAVLFLRAGLYACPLTTAIFQEEDHDLSDSLMLVCAPDRYVALDVGF